MIAFERYKSYKSASIEWLGDIPNHWMMRKVSRSFSTIGSGTTPSSGNEAYYKDGQILWVNSGDLNNGYIIDSERKVNQNALNDFSALKIYKEGSLIVAMYGATIGKLGILQSEASVNQACCVLNDSEYFEIKFVFYWFFVNKQNVVNLGFGGGQPNISQDVIKNLKIQAPPLEEQKQIVNFLDIKSKQIDEFIADKQALITLFEEQKSAIINQAVTKGLDKTAQLKPSGIEWLGDIPNHWIVCAIKHIVSTPITDGPHETPNFYDDGIPFISAEAVSSGKIEFSKMRGFISKEDHLKYSKKYQPQMGDIYMVKSGATTGITAIVDTDADFNIWSPLAVVRCNEKSLPYFVLNFMRSKKFQDAIALNWNFGTQQNIGMGVIQNLSITIPPLEEQKQIVSYLETELAKIDTLIETAKAEITLIEEYKTSLINEVVTGKIKV